MIPHPFNFSDKVIVVTGGSGVLCGAIATALADCGAHVVITGLSRMEKAKQLADKVFAYLDVESCLACRQCSDSCWKAAITVTS